MKYKAAKYIIRKFFGLKKDWIKFTTNKTIRISCELPAPLINVYETGEVELSFSEPLDELVIEHYDREIYILTKTIKEKQVKMMEKYIENNSKKACT